MPEPASTSMLDWLQQGGDELVIDLVRQKVRLDKLETTRLKRFMLYLADDLKSPGDRWYASLSVSAPIMDALIESLAELGIARLKLAVESGEVQRG